MAALDLLVSRLRPDDLILAPHDCYGGTMRLLKARSGRRHCCVRFVDQSDSEAFKAALADVPALVLIETPRHPLLRVVDSSVLPGFEEYAGAAVSIYKHLPSPAHPKTNTHRN